MKINRNNYEEYFLDFSEGKLSASLKTELENFLQSNPDLRNEFEQFENLSFADNSKIKFNQKSSLKKIFISTGAINENNYENFLIGKIENDLDSEEKKNLETFISINPFVEREQKLFYKTILRSNEEIEFQHKTELKKTAIIRINRQQTITAIAIAASIMLLLYFNFRKENPLPAGGNEIVEQKKEKTSKAQWAFERDRVIVQHKKKNDKYEKNPVAETSKEKITRHKVRSESNPLAENSKHSAINSQQLIIDSLPVGQASQQLANNSQQPAISKQQANLESAAIDHEITETISEKKEEFNHESKTTAGNMAGQGNNKQKFNSDEPFTLKEFLAFSFRKNVLKEKVIKNRSKSKITPFDFASAAVKGASKIFGSKIRMDKKYKDNGELAVVSFSSPRFEVSRTLHGK